MTGLQIVLEPFKYQQFLTSDITRLLAVHCKLEMDKIRFKQENDSDVFSKDWDGNINGDMTTACFSKYGDTISEALLIRKTKMVSNIFNKQLTPTYSFWRIYEETSTLPRHKDRQSCQYSITICLDTNVSGWPLYVDHEDKVYQFDLSPGDAVLYDGVNDTHWRQGKCNGRQIQLMLHYVDVEYADKLKYDRRSLLGLPSKYKSLPRI